MRAMMRKNQEMREENLKLSFEITKMKKEMGKVGKTLIKIFLF